MTIYHIQAHPQNARSVITDYNSPYRDHHRIEHLRNQEFIKKQMEVERYYHDRAFTQKRLEGITMVHRAEKELAARPRLLNII